MRLPSGGWSASRRLAPATAASSLPARYRYLLIPLIMRHLYDDHELQEDIVRGSQLDWVIVRPGAFSKGGRSGPYRPRFHGRRAVAQVYDIAR